MPKILAIHLANLQQTAFFSVLNILLIISFVLVGERRRFLQSFSKFYLPFPNTFSGLIPSSVPDYYCFGKNNKHSKSTSMDVCIYQRKSFSIVILSPWPNVHILNSCSAHNSQPHTDIVNLLNDIIFQRGLFYLSICWPSKIKWTLQVIEAFFHPPLDLTLKSHETG